jgi:hypothetical protein
MARFRLAFLVLMNVLMLVGVTPSSASAVEFDLEATACRGTIVTFCWAESEFGELKELVGEEEFSALLDNGPATLTAGGLNATISCAAGENVLSVSRLKQLSPLSEDYHVAALQLRFSGCTVSGVKCTTREPIEIREIEGTPESLSLELSETWVRFKPEAAAKEVFAELAFEGSECPENLRERFTIKGEQWCEWQEILLDLEERLLDCEPSESKISFDEREATFQARFEVEPDNGSDLWGIEKAGSVVFELKKEACTGANFVAFCWVESEGGELLELVGEEEFSALLDNGPATLTAGGLNATISCAAGENVSSVGRLVQLSPLSEDYHVAKLELRFSGCSVSGVKCTAKEPIVVKETEATPESLSLEFSETWVRFKPEIAAKEVFAEITFEGSECPETVAGKEPVKGEQWCDWQEILLDLEERLLDCEPSQGKLRLGKNEATFSASFETELDNAGSDLWDIEETA